MRYATPQRLNSLQHWISRPRRELSRWLFRPEKLLTHLSTPFSTCWCIYIRFKMYVASPWRLRRPLAISAILESHSRTLQFSIIPPQFVRLTLIRDFGKTEITKIFNIVYIPHAQNCFPILLWSSSCECRVYEKSMQCATIKIHRKYHRVSAERVSAFYSISITMTSACHAIITRLYDASSIAFAIQPSNIFSHNFRVRSLVPDRSARKNHGSACNLFLAPRDVLVYPTETTTGFAGKHGAIARKSPISRRVGAFFNSHRDRRR